jgi:hypothetical protein
MIFYALVSGNDNFAVDLFASLRRAEEELENVLRDEPSFEPLLRIVPVRLEDAEVADESPAPE